MMHRVPPSFPGAAFRSALPATFSIRVPAAAHPTVAAHAALVAPQTPTCPQSSSSPRSRSSHRSPAPAQAAVQDAPSALASAGM